MTDQFRALCAELIEAVLSDDSHIDCMQIARRARALLDQPVADGEVAELVNMLTGIAYWKRHGKPGEDDPSPFDIRQADRLTRAAFLLEQRHPTPVPVLPDDALIIEPAEHTLLVPVAQPVPVSERLPGPEDCDEQGRCWLGGDQLASGSPTWILGYPAWASRFPDVHYCWLPAHALPTPEATND